MSETCRYIVAGHLFEVTSAEGVSLEKHLEHYAPFAVTPGSDRESSPVFTLEVVPSLPRPEGLVEEMRQDDDGSQILVARMSDGRTWFEFDLFGKSSGWMIAEGDCSHATLALLSHPEFGLNNALMVLFALSTARLRTALFHAAVIGNSGRGYLFLGKSGTGKSTHARLWLKHIEGSELVNDDNPVVRVFDDGSAVVYGSPWSGKTPCYRNIQLPVGGFVSLAQAPFNRIRRLEGIEAYAALVPSISGKRWDRAIADGLHETENSLAMNVPVWHLDCLPDEDAARLCHSTVTNG